MNNRVRPIELACPHDGWYNGNPKLMIINGTYDDYRFRLAEWVRLGKMQAGHLEQFDAEWAALDINEKMNRRNKVLKSQEFKAIRMKDGKTEMVTTPSNNGQATRPVPKFYKKPSYAQVPGALSARTDPFAGQQVQVQAQGLPAAPPLVAPPQAVVQPPQANPVPQAVRAPVPTNAALPPVAAPPLQSSVAPKGQQVPAAAAAAA